MEWPIFYLMIFVIIILCFQIRESEEDKHFLREGNISLRNDLKKYLFKNEISNSQKGRRDEDGKCKNKKTGKVAINRGRVFIFEDAESEEETEKIFLFRKLLKKHSVTKLMLICLEDLRLKMFDEDDESVVEEIFAINENPSNLPIIFCGKNHDDFLGFLYFCGWEDREDMEWVENPWDIDDLKEVLKEISRR